MNHTILNLCKKHTLLIFFSVAFGMLSNVKASVALSPYLNSKFSVQIFNAHTGGSLIVLLSGDGGNTSSNLKLAEALAKTDTTVLLINSKKYFWDQKTPEQFATDIEELILEYMKKEKKTSFSVAGYSFGADVVSFLPKRISPQLDKKMQHVLLFSPSETTDYVIKIADMLPLVSKKRKYNVIEEISSHGRKVVCILGGDKEMYQKLSNTKVKILQFSGGHNFNNNFDSVVRELRKSI
ncbi:MAG: virulence factor [Sphingobacterium sp.]|jgi:type IV secretory pathway VirJ component|nr:virulence factor [Sphingobacterium sp.]